MKSFFLINHWQKKSLLKKKSITLMTSLNNQRLYLQIAALITGQHLHNLKIIYTKQITTQVLFIATTPSRPKDTTQVKKKKSIIRPKSIKSLPPLVPSTNQNFHFSIKLYRNLFVF